MRFRTGSAGRYSNLNPFCSSQWSRSDIWPLTWAELRAQLCYCTPTLSLLNQVIIATLNPATHHFDGHTGQVLISNGGVIAFHHVYSFSRKTVNDGHVGLQRGRLLRLQYERADATVQLRGQQQVNGGGLDVLLVILVCIERVPQVCWNIFCKREVNW